MLIEGAPPPHFNRKGAMGYYVYVDDYGFIRLLYSQSDFEELRRMAGAVRQRLTKLGPMVHKEEFDVQVTSLGYLLGGEVPRVMGAAPKQWLAIMCFWHLGRCGRGIPAVVESVVSLATWLLMVNRSGLSVLQTVYTWVRENRHEKKEMSIPREVRRELLALSALLPLVEQKPMAGWHRTVYIVDASDEGGGICETVEVIINVPRGVALRTYIFHHLYSGLRREGDLEWYLVRLGASRGLRVIVINYDLAYGQEFDLGSETVVKGISEGGKPRESRRRLQWRSVFDLDPSHVRARRPPASERPRSSMGATPSVAKGEVSLRAAQQAHAQRGRGAGEYLSCSRAWSQRAPRRLWTPHTAFFQGFEKRRNYERVTVPQCMLGAVSPKPTTLSVSAELNPQRYFGDLKC